MANINPFGLSPLFGTQLPQQRLCSENPYLQVARLRNSQHLAKIKATDLAASLPFVSPFLFHDAHLAAQVKRPGMVISGSAPPAARVRMMSDRSIWCPGDKALRPTGVSW
jgi:hypothetical protein